MVNGAYRGLRAKLLGLDQDKFCVSMEIAEVCSCLVLYECMYVCISANKHMYACMFLSSTVETHCTGSQLGTLKILYCIKNSLQWSPSNPDTLGPESTALSIEVPSFQGLKMYCGLL